MRWTDILPTSEEQETEEALTRRQARQLRVFLCHASEDQGQVRELYGSLKQLGFQPWLDRVDLPPGVEWDVAIQDAVRRCHIILVCLSNSSVSKTGYVQKEIRFALDRADEKPEGTVYIIPAKLEPCEVPRRLQKWHSVDLFSDEGHQRLIEALKEHAASLN